MAATPVILAEQRLHRRVVQIDVEPVRHLELDLPQRGVRSGQLLDRAVAAVHHVVPGQVARVSRHLGQDFVARDRGRHVPGRIEQHPVDRGLQLWGLFVRLADDDTGREHRAIAAVEHELGRGGVDHHPIGRHRPRHPAQPLEIDRDLPQPGIAVDDGGLPITGVGPRRLRRLPMPRGAGNPLWLGRRRAMLNA